MQSATTRSSEQGTVNAGDSTDRSAATAAAKRAPINDEVEDDSSESSSEDDPEIAAMKEEMMRYVSRGPPAKPVFGGGPKPKQRSSPIKKKSGADPATQSSDAIVRPTPNTTQGRGTG